MPSDAVQKQILVQLEKLNATAAAIAASLAAIAINTEEPKAVGISVDPGTPTTH